MTSTAERIDALKQKYRTVFDTIEHSQVALDEVYLHDGKLYIHGAAKSPEAREAVLSSLNNVDPQWGREVDLDLRAPGVLEPNTGQTVVQDTQDFATGRDDTGEGK